MTRLSSFTAFLARDLLTLLRIGLGLTVFCLLFLVPSIGSAFLLLDYTRATYGYDTWHTDVAESLVFLSPGLLLGAYLYIIRVLRKIHHRTIDPVGAFFDRLLP
jgi:hypothetical protein